MTRVCSFETLRLHSQWSAGAVSFRSLRLWSVTFALLQWRLLQRSFDALMRLRPSRRLIQIGSMGIKRRVGRLSEIEALLVTCVAVHVDT